MYTFSDDIFSDLHKDVYGFRPRDHRFYAECDEEKQKIWDELIHQLEYNQKAEALAESNNLVYFRNQIRMVMDTCNCNWKDALCYLAQASNLDINFELDYFLWNEGLGFKDRQKIASLYHEG